MTALQQVKNGDDLKRHSSKKFYCEITLLLLQAMEQDLLIPTHSSQGADENYEGATVIEPVRGYVQVSTTTLTFENIS